VFKDKTHVICQDIRDYNPQDQQFGMITACWCLGFLDHDEKKNLLGKINSMLEENGVFLLKESTKREKNDIKGNDYYTGLTTEEFEQLFKDSGFISVKAGELEYQYGDKSEPCEKEVYWVLSKNHSQLEERILFKECDIDK